MTTKCPVCGMDAKPDIKSEYQGKDLQFLLFVVQREV